ncbi:hypothetical protein Z517_09470 [Fonsecaea pedrosoi CBS 271.37]|uniref:Unplaced genomic scaffold supercont1.6, whole genome shotgun sequence n=1 Tax=Fonsecaea pedrosoi CBS 271.37 TaxID=1442368 RepID=A0A0D2GXH4_9EURO|nr:uncharacterized protein Z517_09470 [Fonsecaea pedrosoi CBS 271.37]KIW77024.1 hypothetical protein Z517_09470 [Fonsecaea pedrosoi CBS 271.37]
MSDPVGNNAPPALGEEAASLVSDEVLLRLWNRVQEDAWSDNVALNFWLHLYAKYLFSGKQWIVGVNNSPFDNDAFDIEPLKTDLSVQYLGHAGIQTLFFHMLTGKEATRGDLAEIEDQAYVACVKYLTANPDITLVYAVTSFGTRARIWFCRQGSDSLQELFGSDDGSDDTAEASRYVEAHGGDAIVLRRGFSYMMTSPPVARRGINHGSRSPASSRRN